MRKKAQTSNKQLITALILAALFALFGMRPADAARTGGPAGIPIGNNNPMGGTTFIILDVTFLQAQVARQATVHDVEQGLEQEQDEEYQDELDEEDETPDPFKPSNKFAFKVNDKLYYWILKPTAQGYAKVIAHEARIGVRNFSQNIATPGRLINCLLQAKFKSAGEELARFGINTTIGILGFGDPADKLFHLELNDEDFGQTLACWGLDHVCYFEWTFFGPSSLRDTVGLTVDWALDPLNYNIYSVPVRIVQLINHTSLRIGDYEALMDAALDPYSAKRDAYLQNRQMKVEK